MNIKLLAIMSLSIASLSAAEAEEEFSVEQWSENFPYNQDTASSDAVLWKPCSLSSAEKYLSEKFESDNHTTCFICMQPLDTRVYQCHLAPVTKHFICADCFSDAKTEKCHDTSHAAIDKDGNTPLIRIVKSTIEDNTSAENFIINYNGLYNDMVTEFDIENYEKRCGPLAMNKQQETPYMLALLAANEMLLRWFETSPQYKAIVKQAKKLIFSYQDRKERVAELVKQAVKKNKDIVLKHLLAIGATIDDVTIYGEPLLFYAINMQNEKMTKILIEHGADINGIYKNTTTLAAALMMGNQSIIQTLIEKGASFTQINSKNQSPLIHIAGDFLEPDNMNELISYFIQAKVDLNATDPSGATALTAAVAMNNIDFVNALIEQGVDVNKKDGHGNTPLHYIAHNLKDTTDDKRYKKIDIIKSLKNAQADFTLTNNQGKTAYQLFEDEKATLTSSYYVRGIADLLIP